MIDYVEYVVGSAVAAVFSAITILIRKVLTNEKQIALMQAEIKDRDDRRKEDRAVMMEIKEDLKEVKRDIISLYREEGNPRNDN